MKSAQNGIATGGVTRREFIKEMGILTGGIAAVSWMYGRKGTPAETFIAKAPDYNADLASIICRGFTELGVHPGEIRGKRILLKPNLVEVRPGMVHINTHPLVIRGAIEAFLRFGAEEVLVGEGPGHCRDILYVLDMSGVAEVLVEDRIPFVDINNDALWLKANKTRLTFMDTITLPATLRRMDWIVSLPKMKTHHWAGVTLSMKNLFGVLPGIVYGWPKNVLHRAGIEASILDIYSTLRPHFAIVDGIIGMDGDGPIMGNPHHSGVIVMGRNLPAVDATCSRIMGVDPFKIKHLELASMFLEPIDEKSIYQRGEVIKDTRTDFHLDESIPAQRGIRLA